MQTEVHWLLHFCLEHNLLSENQVKGMLGNLPEGTNIYECSKLLISTGWVKDKDFLEAAINASIENIKSGQLPPGMQTGATPPDTPKDAQTSEKVEGTEAPGEADAETFQDFSRFSKLGDNELIKAVARLFASCKDMGASDLHITGGARPRVRLLRKIKYLSNRPIEDALARRINMLLLNEAQRQQFKEQLDLDYALKLDNPDDGSEMRFRVNLMEQNKGISAAYRIVNNQLMTLEQLGFAKTDTLLRLLDYHNGIILVTGPVGSGKTTTLATLVNELNKRRKDHIITMEDPIEVVQHSAASIISQREVGKHTESFHSALKSALREDPDVIVIGEMRDLTTIEMAITAAETGHLVIATMHTRDAKSTLNRILDVFPPSQQSQIRAMTSGSLRGIICQRQLPGVNNDTILAYEVLLNTNAVANIIRDGKETGLEDTMQSGKRFGMQTMNDSIKGLLAEGKISAEVARENIESGEG